MLSEKPWKLDALMRLAAAVFLSSIFVGTIAGTTIRFFEQADPSNAAAFLASVAGATLAILGALSILCRPWPFEGMMRRMVVLVACAYAGMFLTWLALRLSGDAPLTAEPTTARIVAAVLGFQGVTLVLVHFFLREHQVGWIRGFQLNHDWTRAILIGVAVGFVVIPLGWGVQILSGAIMDRLNVSAPEQQAVQAIRAAAGWQNRLVLGLTAIVLAPWAEEILFRGLMYPVIKQRGYPKLALWGTSVVFGLFHVNLATFIPLTLLGLVLVWVYEKTDNLLAPIATHSLFNTMNFILLLMVDAADRLPLPQ